MPGDAEPLTERERVMLVRRKRAAQRSRDKGLREKLPGVHAVSDLGCAHFTNAAGVCMNCGERVIEARSASQHG